MNAWVEVLDSQLASASVSPAIPSAAQTTSVTTRCVASPVTYATAFGFVVLSERKLFWQQLLATRTDIRFVVHVCAAHAKALTALTCSLSSVWV